MHKHRFTTWVAMLLLAACLNATAFTGGSIRCGKITNFRMVDAVTFTWNTDDYGDQPFLADGEKFGIISVNLSKDRTIGKYDYTLGGERCLAMAQQQDPFDPDAWEFKFSGAATEVHMLYKLKEDAAPYSFAFELTNREPVLKVTTTGVTGFGDGPDPSAFVQAKEPDTATPTAAPTDAGGDDAGTDSGEPDAGTDEPATATIPAEDPGAGILDGGDDKVAEPKPKPAAGGDSILDDW